VQFLNARVDQRFQTIPITVDTKLPTATQGCGWKQDELDESKNTVVFDDFRSCPCFSDLIFDSVWRVEEIYRAVWAKSIHLLGHHCGESLPGSLALILPPFKPGTMPVMSLAR
jgi:hypothetical protein